MKRVDQIIEWLGGEAFDGLIMLDEAHRAKSYRVDKPEASSQMAQAVLLLQESCPNARVVYASATGLQSLESMAYASRLLLWGGANAAFPTFQDFSAKFLKKVSKCPCMMSSVLRGAHPHIPYPTHYYYHY